MLVDVFSRQHGRVGLVARGARRRQSGQAALIQPFRHLSIAWSARGELGTLISIESNEISATGLLTGAALMAGFYVNELIMRLLHRDESHPRLFDDYRDVIFKLADTQTRERTLRLFECRLLEAIGYGLTLDRDIVTGETIIADRLYQYVSERGPGRMEGSAAQADSGSVCIHGGTLLELAGESLQSGQSLREAKALLRQELGRQLGGRPLASRELYQAYLRNQRDTKN